MVQRRKDWVNDNRGRWRKAVLEEGAQGDGGDEDEDDGGGSRVDGEEWWWW